MPDNQLARVHGEIVVPSADVLPADLEIGDTLELEIVLDSDNLPVADLSSYLKLIDDIYGRFQPFGLMSYSLRPENRLKLSEVSKGSLILKICEIIDDLGGGRIIKKKYLSLTFV